MLEGHFQLTSGRHSDRYLEKFNLLQWPQHTEAVCKKIADAARDLDVQTVAGPTTGGMLLAYEVGRQLGVRGIFAENDEAGGRSFQRDFHLEPGERVLVVDDVMTSGGSLRDTVAAVLEAGGEVVGVAVVVDRTRGQTDFGVPFISATEVEMDSWEAADCQLCRDGVPLKIT